MQTNVRPLLVSTSDINGGAARAAYRIHEGLHQIGVKSRLLAYYRDSGDPHVVRIPSRIALQMTKLAITTDNWAVKRYRNRDRHTTWSVNMTPNGIASQINKLNPDIVHLNWIGKGFIPIGALGRIQKPMLWRLPDMWAFTGGCHFSGNCKRYEQECGACPLLNSSTDHDLSRRILHHKLRKWKGTKITFVAPSTWIADCTRSSRVLRESRIEVIPNGLDTTIYKPMSVLEARHLLNLPPDKPIILFGALRSLTDKRKGVEFLLPALKRLAQQDSLDAELVVFGAKEPDNPPDFGFPVHYLGHLHDNISLTVAYSAADVMVVPSIQETFGQTASEAMACGTPVVAFGATGLLDIVDHQETGYLATPYESDDLAKGIAWVLEDKDRLNKLSAQAREKAINTFDSRLVAKQYLALYHEILAKS